VGSTLNRRLALQRIPGPFASLYEKATRFVIESYYRGLAQEVVGFLQTGRILDLGTGPGYLPIEIVKRSPELTVVGIDLSRSLIKMARRNAVNAGVADRLHFEVGDASRLRFPDASFDMVLSTGMLHMLKDPVAVLRECNRVLKYGREAWFFDPARVSSQIDKKKWRASLSLLERFMYLVFSFYVRLDPPKTVTKSDALRMIRATPFKDFRVAEKDGELELRLRKDPASVNSLAPFSF
jgi:ubiquinone/menaquinone biosynthesis C-methylase UbiE